MKIVKTEVKKDSDGAIPDFFSLFNELPAIDPFEDQKESIAIDLGALISYHGFTRAKFIEKSGWKQSRLSNVLSGRCNLTIKTVHEVAEILGYRFDLIYRKKGQKRAAQIWERDDVNVKYFTPRIELRMQSSFDVLRDCERGVGASVYFSMISSNTGGGELNRYLTPELEDNTLQSFNVIPMAMTNTINSVSRNKKAGK
nr:hypothetical protein [uncultured Undibacterium sp.]